MKRSPVRPQLMLFGLIAAGMSVAGCGSSGDATASERDLDPSQPFAYLLGDDEVAFSHEATRRDEMVHGSAGIIDTIGGETRVAIGFALPGETYRSIDELMMDSELVAPLVVTDDALVGYNDTTGEWAEPILRSELGDESARVVVFALEATELVAFLVEWGVDPLDGDASIEIPTDALAEVGLVEMQFTDRTALASEEIRFELDFDGTRLVAIRYEVTFIENDALPERTDEHEWIFEPARDTDIDLSRVPPAE